MDYDPGKIQTIFSNLVGNAIKFTQDAGEVVITVDGGRQTVDGGFLGVIVKDNGVGIPQEQLPFIFDRFYQVDDSATRKGEGTGIGLALTKELVKLLKGQIEVESREGQGATFTVWLPVRQEAPRTMDLPEVEVVSLIKSATTIDTTVGPSNGQGRPVALLIEDNVDVLNYLKACIQDNYQVEIANNGKAGIEKAIGLVPDIIISDVMMPEKDGFEVCATLKQDERTSHIPIILLTAKADETSRRAGLQQGADAYLVKPFDKAELEIRLQKLIQLRQRLKEKYSRADLETVNIKKEQDPELLFLKKLETVILDNLSDDDFRVEPDLCRAMMMSRPQLYKKLKALKDQSPSQFVRNIRLQQARKLLLTTRLPIGEIAGQVGFREHSYFTQVYLEAYQETPSDTRNNLILN